VHWGRLDRCDTESLEALLSADERERAASFRFPRDRARYVAARGLLRTLLGERIGLDPSRVEFAYGERGKPRLAVENGLRFNLSHSDGVVALVLSEGRDVGIDVEAERPGPSLEGISRRYLPEHVATEIEHAAEADRPRAFYRAWVRQEAYAKARGAGLALIGESPALDRWTVIDLDSPDGFAGALAIEGGEELVADTVSVGHAGGELGKVVDVVLVRTPQPIR
jgi:4'-phosphopantetheinyl transferase